MSVFSVPQATTVPGELPRYRSRRAVWTTDELPPPWPLRTSAAALGTSMPIDLMECLNIDPAAGATRLSMVHYNTAGEIDRAIEVLARLL